MIFLHRNRKGLNTRVFSESDYVVLNYEQLLKVNGAGGGSGGGGGGSPSGPSGTSGNTTTIIGDYPSGYGACGGGRYVIDTPSEEKKTSKTSSDTTTTSSYSSCGGGTTTTATSSYSSCGGGSNSNSKYVENSNEGVANANVGDKIVRNDGTVVTLTQGDIDYAKSKINGENTQSSPETTTTTTNSDMTTSSTNVTTSSETSTDKTTSNSTSSISPNVTTTTEKTATDKIESAITKIGKKDYVKGGYMCDNYVEEVIKEAGYDPKDYYVDDPTGKEVNKHISELTTSEKKDYTTKASELSEGTYVVFMSDKEGEKESHASILVVDSNGNAYMQDNSSHNNATKWNTEGKAIAWDGGTEQTKGGDATYICSLYTGYENFYFQKLK